MDDEQKKILQKIATTVRGLSIDAVQKANSGHPGLPLGAADIGAYLFAKVLKHSPGNSQWFNRDRFILSAGHGSMLLYSLLYLSGFDMSLDDLKNFRNDHSKTPGHPEYDLAVGIETTTGPLGQGFGNAVGLALASKILAAKFNTLQYPIINNKIYTLVGDGCIMEGVTSEVSSLAGHLNLNNLVVIYDANDICLDGPLSETNTEDVKLRYKSYGFDVYEMDGHDFESIENVFNIIKESQEKPVIIIAKTIIGKGSPNKSGTHKAHGAPLGTEEVAATKKALGLPEQDFYVPQQVLDYFTMRKEKQTQDEKSWNELFSNWKSHHKDLYEEFEKMRSFDFSHLYHDIESLAIPSPKAGRAASNSVMTYLAEHMPSLYAGSADLSSSDMTMMKKYDVIASDNFKGRNIKFGVREFGMGTISSGLALSKMIVPVAGTFLIFSDYLRNAIRLAALSSLKVVYQFTHDSIFLGQDGPTHQPVEHLASLRAMPNLQVIRPADNNEVKMAWIAALKYNGPTALILSRQALKTFDETKLSYDEGVGRGAYIIKRENGDLDYLIFATGSELSLSLDVAHKLETLGKNVRVVSIPCFELFDKQPKEYIDRIIPPGAYKKVSIEAAADFGWHKYIGRDGIAISVDHFGHSAPPDYLAAEFGFTVDSILPRIM